MPKVSLPLPSCKPHSAMRATTLGSSQLPGRQARKEADATDLVIAGLVKLSTCDWPGKLVATVFLQGCPWQCTYCHNPELIDPRAAGSVTWREVLTFLQRRQGLLDGLVFSGGEPCRQAGLANAMREVRELGFGVGLHTGGAFPRRFAQVLPLVDWVGLDIKANPAKFDAVTRVRGSQRPAWACLEMALASDVDVQVRTTIDPTVLTAGDVRELGELLAAKGVKNWVRQVVRTEGTRPEYAAALAAAVPIPA